MEVIGAGHTQYPEIDKYHDIAKSHISIGTLTNGIFDEIYGNVSPRLLDQLRQFRVDHHKEKFLQNYRGELSP